MMPSKSYESPELILSSNYGSGTTVYQGDNRFSLKGIQFFQHKIELTKKDKYFIRAYAHMKILENRMIHILLLKMLEASKSYDEWAVVTKNGGSKQSWISI